MRFAPLARPAVLLLSAFWLTSSPALAKSKATASKNPPAIKFQPKVNSQPAIKSKPAGPSIQQFALGLKALKQKKWSDAKTDFQAALKADPILAAEIHEKMAEADDEEGEATDPNDLRAALQALHKTLDERPNYTVSVQSRFFMSKLELKLGRLQQALDNLRFLQWRSRFSPQYPDILVTLVKVELKENRRYLACRWARELYARFPMQRQVSSWGVDLVEDQIGKLKVGCVPSQRDIEVRMQRLQLSGHAAKARREIERLRGEAKANNDAVDKMQANMLLVQYYEMQGYPYEALQILVKYYKQKKNDLRYQEQLGRVAAQADEFQSAIGAFAKAYHLGPLSSEGKWAGYTAAYLSYQIQDYDGADRRFKNIIHFAPGSYFAQQARWQLAWIEYLKGHYKNAAHEFRELYRRRILYWHWWHHRKIWWARYPYRDERTRYWLAMSLFRQKRYDEARTLFSKLAKAPGLTFYGFLAKNRLAQISTVEKPGPKQLLVTNTKTVNQALGAKADPPDPSTTVVDGSGPTGGSTIQTTADSNPDLSATDAIDDNSDDVATAAGNTDINGEPIEVSAFKNPTMRLRFTRARELMSLGLSDWAKGELFEIERRTRNKTYLHMLMAAYFQAGSFDRSLHIAQDITFEHERQVGGLSGARDLWKFAFPKAYEKNVRKYCLKFGVPEQMVWAIMRAESRFNPNAISAVGARGLVQLMPYTADQLEKLLNHPAIDAATLMRPQTNIELGTRYLARLLRQFSGYVPLVAAAYNAGPQRVYSWLKSFGNLNMDEFVEHIPFVETRNYVKKVVRNYLLYSELYGKHPNLHDPWLTSSIPIKLDRKPSPRENWQSIE